MLADGERALVIANADEERVVRLAAPLREVTLRAGVPCCSTLARATSTSECRSRRSRSWSSRRTSTSSTTPSVGSDPRSTRSATPSSCPTSTPTCSASTSLAAQGRAAVRPARLRQDLIAKAVANSLAKKVAAKTGQEGKSYFLNIKRLRAAQQVLVGETERHIRLVFQRAWRRPVTARQIVFFDEMDSSPHPRLRRLRR
ncbi:MAG: AAA family ATPase [Nocardioides sp.]